MRDIHELAMSIADDAAKSFGSGDNVSISLYNYGVSKTELPKVMKALKNDKRFFSVVATGFMGYVEFKKALAVHNI